MTIDNRTLGAMAIALACILFGFATGRLSAWLVPPAGMTSISSTAKPSVPLQPARTAKPPESTPSNQAKAPEASPKPEPATQEPASGPSEPKQADAPASARPATPEAASRALSPGEAQSGSAWTDPDTKLLNPGSSERARQPESAPSRTPSRFSDRPGDDMRTLTSSPEGLERCRQKYRSFDPSDGTYKPYGQDTRVPCPHLR